MAQAKVIQARVIESSAAVLMARIVKDDGSAIVQADVSSITCNVYDENKNLIASPSLTVAGNVTNTLVKNAAWQADSTGFNFSAKLAGTNWPVGGETYRVEVKFTPTSGNSFFALWDLQAIEVLSS